MSRTTMKTNRIGLLLYWDRARERLLRRRRLRLPRPVVEGAFDRFFCRWALAAGGASSARLSALPLRSFDPPSFRHLCVTPLARAGNNAGPKDFTDRSPIIRDFS
ncbi:hypothetical protein NL676_016157 [Syzygium grande]|nr:hypothetical protein NL676_016157 [Syzygium grande]